MTCQRDRSVERHVYEMPVKDKFASCQRFRHRGNLFFREGQFGRAAVQYQAALVYYEYTFPDEETGPLGQSTLDEIRVQCLSNLAACQLHLRMWLDAQTTCTQGLAESPDKLKLVYRRAVARRHLDDFVGAAKDIARGLAMAPHSLSFRRERTLLRRAVKHYRRNLAKVSRRMFNPTSATLPPSDSPTAAAEQPSWQAVIGDNASQASDSEFESDMGSDRDDDDDDDDDGDAGGAAPELEGAGGVTTAELLSLTSESVPRFE